jgi:PAS domain S-box/diguanylate cyclase (GGDEF) domain
MREDFPSIVLESIDEGVYLVDRDRRIVYWNKAAELITGFLRSQVLGSKCSDNILRHVDGKGKELCDDGCPLAACMEDGRTRTAEVFLHHREGHRVPVSVRGIPIPSNASGEGACIEIFTDRTERSNLMLELDERRKESLTDPLTGLGNRRYAELCLGRAFAARSADDEPFGVLLIDIDHFKCVNDEHGHQNGDRVLRMVGRTLANAVRRIDLAARWGGEAFLILAPGVDQGQLFALSERVRVLISRGWVTLETASPVSVTVSSGGSMALPEDDAASILVRADKQLYASKAAGRDRCSIG